MNHPEFFRKHKATFFLAQRTQWQHKGHKGETLTRLYIQNKIKSRRIALSKSRLCALCAAIVFFVLKNAALVSFSNFVTT
jgi:hypothetical protein